MSHHTKIDIDEKALNSAARCMEDCACAKDDWNPCFKVGELVDEKILLIEKAEDETKMISCRYHLPFGGEHYCICPARLYIYKNFNL